MRTSKTREPENKSGNIRVWPRQRAGTCEDSATCFLLNSSTAGILGPFGSRLNVSESRGSFEPSTGDHEF